MSLEPPPIDTRGYHELFDEALARIPVHTPEWTNRNEADPGVTLLQLWAYMSETLLYRSSLIPERNRIAFLRLLGYGRAPAQAARGIVRFVNDRGPLDPVLLPTDVEVAAGNVPFRTDNGLSVLPVEARAYVKRVVDLDASERDDVDEQYGAAYASFAQDGVDFAYYETTAVDWDRAERTPLDLADTVDGVVWLALLARPDDDVDQVRAAIADRILTLGVVPDETANERVLPPAGTASEDGPGLAVARPDAADALPEELESRVPRYLPLDTSGDTDLLLQPGVVQVVLPGPEGLRTWELDPSEDGVGAFPPALDSDDADRLVTWLRVSAGRRQDDDTSAPAVPRLRWIGINAAMVRQRVHVRGETLGKGTGRSDQTVTLANTPVLADSVELTIGGEPWTQVDDLMAAASEAPLVDGSSPRLADAGERVSVYTLDAGTGQVRFGDGVHGRRPPAGEVITASYDHGGGRDGMVGPGAITKGTSLPAGIKVVNPTRTWGGSEAESVELAEKRIAGHVRHRDRLVTDQDFREIVARTPGVDIGRVEVLSLLDPSIPDVATPGAVTLLLIPRFDTSHPDTPEPDRTFLDTVCRYVDDRRLVTTELHLRGPEYRQVWVSVGIEVLPGRDVAVVRDGVQRQVRRTLSPLHGGASGGGWPLEADVERLEVWAAAARVDGVAKVVGVELASSDGEPVERVVIEHLQLPRLAGLTVQRGDPRPVAELLGATPDDPTPSLPIPFVPAEC